jgi:hypothetical protein
MTSDSSLKDHYSVIASLMKEFVSPEEETVEDILHHLSQKQERRLLLESRRLKWVEDSNEKLLHEKRKQCARIFNAIDWESDLGIKKLSKLWVLLHDIDV